MLRESSLRSDSSRLQEHLIGAGSAELLGWPDVAGVCTQPQRVEKVLGGGGDDQRWSVGRQSVGAKVNNQNCPRLWLLSSRKGSELTPNVLI